MIVHPRSEPVYVVVPSASLLRILVNLLVNARDATLERAATAGPSYRPSISLSVEAIPAEGVGAVIVNDNGTGIPDEIAERIFDLHFTTKGAHGGAGIGLSAARDLARAAGGDLTVTSRPISGTTFRLTLPLAAAPDDDAP